MDEYHKRCLRELFVYFLRIKQSLEQTNAKDRENARILQNYDSWCKALQEIQDGIDSLPKERLEHLLDCLRSIGDYENESTKLYKDEFVRDQHRLWEYCVREAAEEIRSALYSIN